MTYRVKVTVLGSTLLALILLYAVSGLFSPDRLVLRGDTVALVDLKKIADVASFEITAPNAAERTLVRKTSAGWFVEKNGGLYPGSARKVTAFLDALSSAAPFPAVSSAADALVSLGLADKAAGRITAFNEAGERLLDMFVGSVAPDGVSVYLRRSDADAAFSGPAAFYDYATAGTASWYDAAIFQRRPAVDDIERVTIRSSTKGFQYSLARAASGAWYAEAPARPEVDSSKVSELLKTILATDAEDFFAVDGADTIMKAARDSISFELGDGSFLSLYVGERVGDQEFLGATSASPYRYVLSAWSVDRILKPLEALRK